MLCISAFATICLHIFASIIQSFRLFRLICLFNQSASGCVISVEMADFVLPKITDNPNGWGPCAVPEKFKDMPYQPFSKSDRLGKVSSVRISIKL